MTRALFLLALPRAIARDVWAYLTTEPACRWANETGDPDD